MGIMDIQETRRTILKNALTESVVSKNPKSLFKAFEFENENKISDNDFAAFSIFKFEDDKPFFLTENTVKTLKFFDSDNNGTFSDDEFKLLQKANRIGSLFLIAGARAFDKDKNGLLQGEEIVSYNHKLDEFELYHIELLQKELLELDDDACTALFLHVISKDGIDKIKDIFDKIGDDKIFLEKILLAKNWVEDKTPLHFANAKKAKILLNKIGDDRKLLEKVLLAKDIDDNTPLHCADSETTKVILDKIGNDKELLKKVLYSKNIDDEIPIDYLQYNDKQKINMLKEKMDFVK